MEGASKMTEIEYINKKINFYERQIKQFDWIENHNKLPTDLIGAIIAQVRISEIKEKIFELELEKEMIISEMNLRRK